MQAIDRPAAFLTAHERRLTEVQRELAIVAVVRLARDNPQDAAEYAGALNLLLTPEQRGIVWGRIGHMAALRLMREANEWYRRGGENVGIGPDAARVDEVLEWQVRSALRANDWKTVKTAIERMSPALRDDPTWIYWYGRALHEAGRPAEAQDQFARIAQQFHFYGQLAAEELRQAIVLPPRAEAPTAEEVAPFESNTGFVRAFKFYELGMRLEGNREWNWQMRGLNDRQLLAAAEFARKRGVLDRMISTSDRTKSEFDFAQRFPAPFRDSLIQYSAPLGLDENWIYGLIRQESRFIMDARSSVGASGLMQLMPATARYVAKRLNVPNYTPARVNELEVNLQLGTGYLKMVLDDLDGLPIPPPRHTTPARAACVALVVGEAGRRSRVRRDDPVQRNPRLRQEGDVEQRLLRRVVRCQGVAAIVKGSPGNDCSEGGGSDRAAVARTLRNCSGRGPVRHRIAGRYKSYATFRHPRHRRRRFHRAPHRCAADRARPARYGADPATGAGASSDLVADD